MNNNEYKKNYKPLIVWLIIYMIIITVPLIIVEVSEKIITGIIVIITFRTMPIKFKTISEDKYNKIKDIILP